MANHSHWDFPTEELQARCSLAYASLGQPRPDPEARADAMDEIRACELVLVARGHGGSYAPRSFPV